MRRLFGLVLLALMAIAPRAQADDRLNVVASFSSQGDFFRHVGRDRVNVPSLVGPDSDAHV